jgi:hypothetical protein
MGTHTHQFGSRLNFLTKLTVLLRYIYFSLKQQNFSADNWYFTCLIGGFVVILCISIALSVTFHPFTRNDYHSTCSCSTKTKFLPHRITVCMCFVVKFLTMNSDYFSKKYEQFDLCKKDCNAKLLFVTLIFVWKTVPWFSRWVTAL